MTNPITRINGVDIVTVDKDGETYVPVKPICEILGVKYSSQLEKLQNDDTFSSSTIPLRGIVAADGKSREMVCLPLMLVYLWLGTISPNNVSEEARPKVVAYRLECAKALYDHFAGRARLAEDQARAEAELLRRKNALLEGIKASKAEIRELDGKLEKLSADRLNPQPKLF